MLYSFTRRSYFGSLSPAMTTSAIAHHRRSFASTTKDGDASEEETAFGQRQFDELLAEMSDSDDNSDDEHDKLDDPTHDPDYLRSGYREIGVRVDTDRLMDNCAVIDPLDHHATLIWLHGMDKDVDEMEKVFEVFHIPNTRIVIPWAPPVPITALNEEDKRTWFDLEDVPLSEDVDEDHRGIKEISEKLKVLIDEEVERIDSRKIILAGFGQGGAMALHMGLRYPKRLGGILSFSGYVPLPEQYPMAFNEAQRDIPIIAFHGGADDVVPRDFAVERYEDLSDGGFVSVDVRSDHHMQHFMSETMMAQMHMWLMDTIQAAQSIK